jgi:hypothetical protein
VKVRMFEPLQPDTEVREHMTYAAGTDLLVTFTHQNVGASHYGYDLYDFDDLVFQTSRDFSSLEEAKTSAMKAVARLNA